MLRSKNFQQKLVEVIPFTIYEPSEKLSTVLSDFSDPEFLRELQQRKKKLNAKEIAVFFDSDGSLVVAFVV